MKKYAELRGSLKNSSGKTSAQSWSTNSNNDLGGDKPLKFQLPNETPMAVYGRTKR